MGSGSFARNQFRSQPSDWKRAKSFLQMTKRILIFLLLATLLRGGTITFTFSGQVTYLDASGAGLSVGDQFSGTFSYDEDASLFGIVEQNTRSRYSTGIIDVTAGITNFYATSGPQLQIFDGWSDGGSVTPRDNFFLSVRQNDAEGAGYYLLQIDMLDMTASTLTGLGIPTASAILDMSQNGRLFIRRFSSLNVEEGNARGDLVNVAVVPEPSTYAAIFGVCALGFVAYRRHRQKKAA